MEEQNQDITIVKETIKEIPLFWKIYIILCFVVALFAVPVFYQVFRFQHASLKLQQPAAGIQSFGDWKPTHVNTLTPSKTCIHFADQKEYCR